MARTTMAFFGFARAMYQWLGVAAVVAVASCNASEAPSGPATNERAQAVIGAELSTNDPAVVALVANGGRVFCTGTLVSPRVVVTAAHCIDDGGSSFAVLFGNDAAAGGVQVDVQRVKAHPLWTGNLNGGNDIGLLLIAAAQPTITPIVLNRTVPTIGGDYRVVGFGIHDRDTRELDGKKRTAIMKMIGFTSTYVELDDRDPANAPDTAICQGDSGGPGFITADGVERIAGVHSYSIQGCTNPSGDSRIDLFTESFLQPWIDQNDPSCGADGKCAKIGCSNDPDCQPCGGDGTCAMNCPMPDLDCPTSQLGELCRADSQCVTGKCVYWTQDPRVRFCSQPCAAGCPETMSCQTIAPFGDICYYDDVVPGSLGTSCSADTDCAEFICEAGTCTYPCSIPDGKFCAEGFECGNNGNGFRCYGVAAVDEGGCSSTGSSSGGVTLLMLGVGLLAMGSRRRRM